MQSQNRFFDDISKMATGAMGTLAGVGREMEASMKARFEEFIGGLDLVKRDEFEAVKTLAANARAEADALKARVAALEAAGSGSGSGSGSAARRKTAAPAPSTAKKATRKPPAKP